MGADGVDLIQAYCDRTSDVQTTALLSSFIIANSLLLNDAFEPDARLNKWILTYKSILNQWKLWKQRAKFDVARALLHASIAPSSTLSTPLHTQVSPTAQAASRVTSPNSSAVDMSRFDTIS